MLQELDHGLKQRPPDWPELPGAGEPQPTRAGRGARGRGRPRRLAGVAALRLGQRVPGARVDVPAFAIDEHPVTNAEFAEFVEAGGYAEPRLWREDDWAWRTRRCLEQPHAWRRDGDGFRVRGLLEDVALRARRARGRPGELGRGRRLRALARGPAADRGRVAPRGPRHAGGRRAALALGRRAARRIATAASTSATPRPLPVGSHPSGASAWGVHELVGNGWEWTGTPFAPFPGFEPMPRYPGYSADFFDGAHFVLLGGSWATDEALLRPSFRNWFQPHYPYVFSKFRCARSL